MGQLITKEWNLFNRSNEKIMDNTFDGFGSPVNDSSLISHNSFEAYDRLRILKEDPRSPSVSISRTPIEVPATPNTSDQVHVSKKIFGVGDNAGFSPIQSPNINDSPVVGLLKKSNTATASDLQRKLFRRRAVSKMQAFDNETNENSP